MPELVWSTKRLSFPPAAQYKLDSLVYPQGKGYPEQKCNDRLILGDNLALMLSLLGDYEGKFDLIYADPPFFTNRHYSARIGRQEDSRRPKEWQLAKGYPDAWQNIEAYLDMLYPRLVLMHRLLSAQGTLYLHLDWHATAYARLLLDEIFGAERLLNEIVWLYHGPSPIRSAFNRKHDTILAYTKSDRYIFNVDDVRQPYDPSTVRTFASSKKAGFGKVPDLQRGKVPEDWWYFPVVARLHGERTGYPTQKPEALLERIILASSNPGSLVGDFFCGAGTTAIAAARHARHYIVNDITWRAVHFSKSRLVASGATPFQVEMDKSSQPKLFLNRLDERFISIYLDSAKLTIELNPPQDCELDYWEVDPNWDGQVFNSAGQNMRGRKKLAAEVLISLPHLSDKICVRLVTSSGETYQQDLNI